MIHVSAKHRIVGVPVRDDITNMFPTARVANLGGNELVLLPHGIAETNFLRTLGLSVPAPVGIQYDWEGGKPFDVQIKTAEVLTQNQRAYVLNGMGTGKTKAALWSWRYLNRIGAARRLLVVAPLSTLNFTWAREIFNTLPGVTCQVLHGTRAKRLERLAVEADVYVINHDGMSVIAEELKHRPDIDAIVIDELATYRNGMSKRNKALRKVVRAMKWAWGMTGSPTPNEPTDAWGQAMLLTPDRVPPYFKAYRDELMVKITEFKRIPKDDALEKVHRTLQPAVRFTLDDVVELPDLIERQVDVEMGAKQAMVYAAMEKEAYAAIEAQEITAMNAGAVLSKLLQISLGYVYTREGETVPLDNDKRLDALVDMVMSTDRKVIVFAPFKHALAGIRERLETEGVDTAEVSGDTPKNERDEIFSLFQNTDRIKAIVAHPQCMSHGLTLTAADTIIWFGPIADLEIFEQANARIRRVGQTHKQQVLMLQATKVERRLYAKLRSKQRVQNDLLSLFAEQSMTTTA